MSQQQYHSSSNRKCWNTARERNRLRARFEINERVKTGTPIKISTSCSTTQGGESIDVTKQLLHKISEGSVSSFSLSTLFQRATIISSPVDSSMLSEYKITTLCTSRYGKDRAEQIKRFCFDARDTCTMMEYAVLLGEYRIIGSLIVGGIDPTISGLFSGGKHPTTIPATLSKLIMQRFFTCFPLSLSTYIVKRIVEMRLEGWLRDEEINQSQIGLLCFGSPCYHRFSEERLWQDLLDNVDQRMNDDVVECPICGSGANQTMEPKVENNANVSLAERGQQSLKKYLGLPFDSKVLKLSHKRKKAPKKLTWAKSWPSAVAQSLGNCQSVRRDKFWSFVEQGSYHFVRGCLVQGIDVNMTNEYGQTALYVSVWKGCINIVELLMDYGADLQIAANGGSSVFSIAQAKGAGEILFILNTSNICSNEEQKKREGTKNTILLPERSGGPSPQFEILISVDSCHPGAGSFIIHDALPESCIKAIVSLWKTLPVAASAKKKKTNLLSSSRFYFCDSHKWVVSLLEKNILQTHRKTTTVKVLPHMRFLYYEHAGSVLAPHVDLCRVDAEIGQRSTHTFILYLSSCSEGGETVLLDKLTSKDETLATISPKLGRLLLFPHACPHMGNEVIDVPKLLLRGEVIIL